MIPPTYVKRVAVKNTSTHRVKVTATFGSDAQEKEGQTKIVETRELDPQEEVTFDEHEYDMGSWAAVAALDSIHAEDTGSASNNELKATYKPQVTTIVDLLNVEIRNHESTGALHVAAV